MQLGKDGITLCNALMRMICNASALAHSARSQFTAVVSPYPMGATMAVMVQREMGRRLSCSRSDM
ncbi:MAG: hypothetical protein MR208_00265 [Oscillospiraceae bacterium]|nr:hypothetical protein [Oscillospiraceae bacterium]